MQPEKKLFCRGHPVPVRMLKLSLAEHVNDFDTCQDSLCTPEGFEPRHQLYPAFDVGKR
jgi:hypothetical protein